MQNTIFYNHDISSGFDLLSLLKKNYYVGNEKSWWWPSFLSLRVENGIELEGSLTHEEPNLSLCFAALLGQNTKYEYAESALYNLYDFLSLQLYNSHNEDQNYQHAKNRFYYIAHIQYSDKILDIIANMKQEYLAMLIKKSGFYHQKSQRIIQLAQNILRDFNNFTNFSSTVTQEWLLQQKGIGYETATSILNYGLKKEAMVVDNYTQRLLAYIGIIIEDYEEIQNFLTTGLEKAYKLYDYEVSLAQIMARFHGKIVEYAKYHKLPKYI